MVGTQCCQQGSVQPQVDVCGLGMVCIKPEALLTFDTSMCGFQKRGDSHLFPSCSN